MLTFAKLERELQLVSFNNVQFGAALKTNLEEAKLVRSFMGTDDEGSDVTDVGITTGNL